MSQMPERSIPEVPLTTLRNGEAGVIMRIDVNGAIGGRLLSLGFVPGTEVQVLRSAPLGDPTEYELRGSRLCLRRSEAGEIHVCRTAEPRA